MEPQQVTAEKVRTEYPIHWMVWNNQLAELKEAIEHNAFTKEQLEVKDPRGRTPLMLAVTLGYTDVVKVLIEAGADVNCEKDGWSAVQEATVIGDQELLSVVLGRRDYTRHVLRSGGVPDLLNKLSLAPDFYVEMKWEFTSWVPLVSRMCPSDTYKVYKRGGNVRVDTTLVGFENNKWQRGDRTYIFTGQGTSACLIELDHERKTCWTELMEGGAEGSLWPPPSRSSLVHRLAAPVAINYLDTDKISFERNKSGIWGWRADKTEEVNGYECKVFGANNVELVSKTRTEHLSEAAAARHHSANRAPLAPLLSTFTDNERTDTEHLIEPPEVSESNTVENQTPPVPWEVYFSNTPLEYDIGRHKQETTKVQKFKATLWLCENYPLQLQEQIMPILDLMSTMSSPHFAKLKDFIQMQLPSGFPVKIEIPLFHVLNARVTFGNIFATEQSVSHVSSIQEDNRLSCVIDDVCFAVPTGYRDTTLGDDRQCGLDDEEGLLQYAIEQSLLEAGTHDEQVDVWEALRSGPPSRPTSPRPVGIQHDHEQTQLQRAIEASLSSLAIKPETNAESGPASLDNELLTALQISAQEQHKRELELQAEQRALDEAIRLSLLDKSQLTLPGGVPKKKTLSPKRLFQKLVSYSDGGV